MPRIISVGTALPEYVLEQRDVKEFARAMFEDVFPGDIDRLTRVYDNAQIERRHFCVPLEWFAEPRDFREKNDLYKEKGLELAEQAIGTCLNSAGLCHADIEYILFVSTTGLATPSMDALLMERLPFGRRTRRLPIWGLGCAGGASGIARAREIAVAEPGARVLVVVLELCGLTFKRDDLSKAAMIATALFADGAAAVLVAGDDVPNAVNTPQPRVLASQTTTMPGSLDVMGWDISGAGFGIVISRDIPTIVKTFMRDSINQFLDERGMSVADITHFIAHPGGAKVLEAYQESLGKTPDDFRHTWDVLRNCGNMSAVSILFVLERYMNEMSKLASAANYSAGYGLMGALGPGFSSELVLLQWE